MKKIPTIAIFDIGKTNKKMLLFDENYDLVWEQTRQLRETTDEDGFPCEDVMALTGFIQDTFARLLADEKFAIKAINFSAYGASFVCIDRSMVPMQPLYNYLKPFPPALKDRFYREYGGQDFFARTTASPVLGNLNSGMQLYRLHHEKPEIFKAIKYALHLPQYISYILTGKVFSDLTSIGSHTNLWDFQRHCYHPWVEKEGVAGKLAPIVPGDMTSVTKEGSIRAGIGLHDSSAALIPYLMSFNEPFLLLSTGTWCITLNPFNEAPLTDAELKQDCLCYLSYEGRPVKASRLFAGHEHEKQVGLLAEQFEKPLEYYQSVVYDPELLTPTLHQDQDSGKDFNGGQSYEAAYHHLMAAIVSQQVDSINLVVQKTSCRRIFVDGGFSKNAVFMNLLAQSFAGMEMYASFVPQASALGAALVMHRSWNDNVMPADLIRLKDYSVPK
jgi:sugar (pentulose or hexulose) kinase